MPAIAAPERTSAQVIDFQAARRRAGRDAPPLRLFQPPRPGLLTRDEHLALVAVAAHIASRKVLAPIVLPLPSRRPGVVDRLFGGAL